MRICLHQKTIAGKLRANLCISPAEHICAFRSAADDRSDDNHRSDDYGVQERNDKRFEEYAWLYMKLLEAIFSIGNGQTPETAFKVIDIEDEHILKGALGFIGGTESLYAREDLPGRIFTVWNRNGQKLYFEELCFEDKNGLQLK